MNHGVIQRHPVMPMPSLDNPRECTGKIYFTESGKNWGIFTQHMHDFPTLIKNLPQWRDNNTGDHRTSGK
jgi:hypothetical protein